MLGNIIVNEVLKIFIFVIFCIIRNISVMRKKKKYDF